MKFNKYIMAESIEEAYELNQKKNNIIVAGNLWLKMESRNIGTAIDLSNLGLDKIEEDDEKFSIGAMVTLRELELNKSFSRYTQGASVEALKHIVGVQFRNCATVGGSVFGRYGFSDVDAMLMGLDCHVELYKRGMVKFEEFMREKMDNDILLRVIVNKVPVKITYSSLRNTVTDFPVLTCACSFIDGKCKTVIGARPGKPISVYDKKNMLDETLDEKSINEFAQYVSDSVEMASNLRGSSEYRTHLAKVLTKRGWMKIMSGEVYGNNN